MLRSELYRVAAMIVLCALALVIVAGRSWLAPRAGASLNLAGGPLVLSIGLLYEIGVFVALTARLRQQRPPPRWFWMANIVIECSLPTIGIALLWGSDALTARQALTSPTVLAYPAFIMLSTLRMRALLSFIAGVICGLEYLAIVILVERLEPMPLTTGHLPTELLYTYPAVLVLVGVAAAFVAARLGAHVTALMREAGHRKEIEREIEVARIIQQGLMPQQPPDMKTYEIAGWNRPAAQTGGDFYDWQRLPNGALAITLADVTGHGLGPALVTAFCRAYARATFFVEQDLALVLERINELLKDDLPDDRFVTFVAALLDDDSDNIELLSAGHGPVILYRAADRAIEARDADGVPLGVIDHMTLQHSGPIPMLAGDLLVLVTDGFFEWTDQNNEQFGIERLCACIRENADLPPASLIDTLRRRVEAFVGGTVQADDLTAVIVRRSPAIND